MRSIFMVDVIKILLTEIAELMMDGDLLQHLQFIEYKNFDVA